MDKEFFETATIEKTKGLEPINSGVIENIIISEKEEKILMLEKRIVILFRVILSFLAPLFSILASVMMLMNWANVNKTLVVIMIFTLILASSWFVTDTLALYMRNEKPFTDF